MRPLVYKVLMPAVITFAGVVLALSPPIRPAGVFLCSVIAFQGIVQFIVVGLVNPTEECLLYKRFFKWRRIEYSDIVKCSRPIYPLFWGLHYIKLRSFEAPLGRLYFIQYHRTTSLSQYEQDREMIEFLRARIAGKTVPIKDTSGVENSNVSAHSSQKGVKACAVSAISSMLMVLFLRLILSWPGPNFPPKIAPGQDFVYRLNVYWWHFCVQLLGWPYNVAVILALLIGIGVLRFRGQAVTLSAVLGAILGGVAARWFD